MINLDQEQKEVLDYKGSCYVIGPPGTGKTEIFIAKAVESECTSAFLPFTKAARQELITRLPKTKFYFNKKEYEVLKGDITVATINAFCQRSLSDFPGSYHMQLINFLRILDKEKYGLVGVDEIQDLRPLHFEVIKSIKGGTLLAGGDPYQTIFTFGDALGFEIFNNLDKMDCKRFNLHNNYRSGKEVIDLLNLIYPRDIKALGPKTYNRIAIFARTHNQLQSVSEKFALSNIPHILRLQDGSDITIGTQNNIYLMVTHACKGLGFDKVYQLDWNEPFDFKQTNEETNLLYVSVARASKEFTLVEGHEFSFCYRQLKKTNCRIIDIDELIGEVSIYAS